MKTRNGITDIRTSQPVARLRHTCTICGQPIDIGTRYVRYVYKDMDAVPTAKFWTSRVHIQCGPAILGGRNDQ